jgi:hypothetical protein
MLPKKYFASRINVTIAWEVSKHPRDCPSDVSMGRHPMEHEWRGVYVLPSR